jgi:hypothetical protein
MSFFITDQMAKKEILVAWCHMEDMSGDFGTKLVQESSFQTRRMRDIIMRVVPQDLPRVVQNKEEEEEEEEEEDITVACKLAM